MYEPARVVTGFELRNRWTNNRLRGTPNGLGQISLLELNRDLYSDFHRKPLSIKEKLLRTIDREQRTRSTIHTAAAVAVHSQF